MPTVIDERPPALIPEFLRIRHSLPSSEKGVLPSKMKSLSDAFQTKFYSRLFVPDDPAALRGAVHKRSELHLTAPEEPDKALSLGFSKPAFRP